jgi:hypothetical protein
LKLRPLQDLFELTPHLKQSREYELPVISTLAHFHISTLIPCIFSPSLRYKPKGAYFKQSSLMKNASFFLTVPASLLLFAACEQPRSQTTAWKYNDPRNGGMDLNPYGEQETGPGLVLVQGGTFTMGRCEQDVTHDWNNIPRRVTVSSFYMDITEVRNLDYLEYLHWTEKVFGPNFYDVVKKALPDTLAWRDPMAYNEP